MLLLTPMDAKTSCSYNEQVRRRSRRVLVYQSQSCSMRVDRSWDGDSRTRGCVCYHVVVVVGRAYPNPSIDCQARLTLLMSAMSC